MTDNALPRQVSVGIVIVVALAVLGGAILMIGGASKMFSRKVHYKSEFHDVLGLKVGSPIYMSGVQIGSVERLELPTNPEKQAIPVGLAVDRQYAERIREGTKASLKYLQILSGDRLVILTPGEPTATVLAEGSSIPPTEGSGLFEAGATAAESISALAEKLNTILDPIEKQQGIIGKAIGDPNFGKEGLENINASFKEAREALRNLNEGGGLLPRLLHDQQYAQTTLSSLQGSIDRLNGILSRVDNNEGAIGALLQEGGEGDQAITEFRAAAADLREILAQVQKGQGLLNRLVYDEALSRQISEDLKRSTAAMASIMEKIDRGEGSLGALINDPKIYEGLNDVVGGIRGSSVGRRIIRHYEKKGFDERMKKQAADGKKSAPEIEPQSAPKEIDSDGTLSPPSPPGRDDSAGPGSSPGPSPTPSPSDGFLEMTLQPSTPSSATP